MKEQSKQTRKLKNVNYNCQKVDMNLKYSQIGINSNLLSFFNRLLLTHLHIHNTFSHLADVFIQRDKKEKASRYSVDKDMLV